MIDNASQKNALGECEQRYPNVQFIRLEENIGFAAANNLGIQAAQESDQKSEWVALLNPDAFPQSGWLAALWRAAQKYPDYTFFGSCLLRAACPTQIDGIGDTYHVSGLAWRQDHGRRVSAETEVGREIFAPCAAAALYRRDIFVSVGGFDEQYFCYGEDIDLAFRLRLMGQRCWYVPDAIVHHVGSASTAPKSDFSLYYGHRNLMWTYIKNMPSPLVWYYLPQHILLNIVTLFWFSVRGRAKVIWKAKTDGLCGVRRAWRLRRRIQTERQVEVRELGRSLAKGCWMPYRRNRSQATPHVPTF